MNQVANSRKNPRPKETTGQVHIKCYLTKEKKQEFEAQAKKAGMSASKLLRRLVDGHAPYSTGEDRLANIRQAHGFMKELRELKADLARTGNLFKLMLSDDSYFTATMSESNIETIMNDLVQLRLQIEEIIKDVKQQLQKL